MGDWSHLLDYWITGLDEVLDLGAIGIYEIIRFLSRNGDAIASAK
jgi:hypothetical protein